MKQVTMESVKQRIADLESAGKVVGGLSLSSEFELSCLRELVAVTEQRDALVAANIGMDKFVDTMLDIAWKGGSADGFDIQDAAIVNGLIRAEVYCADEHENLVDDPGNFEDGDTVYFRVETPASSAILDSLRAEGVDKLATFAGEEYQRCAKMNKAEQRKWRGIVHLCVSFARQLRESKGAQK